MKLIDVHLYVSRLNSLQDFFFLLFTRLSFALFPIVGDFFFRLNELLQMLIMVELFSGNEGEQGVKGLASFHAELLVGIVALSDAFPWELREVQATFVCLLHVLVKVSEL